MLPPTPSTPPATSGLTALPPFSTTSTARLQALYSDFSRQKNSNPDAYASNVDWWRRALEVVVASGMQLHHLRAPVAGTMGTATPRRKGWASGDYDEDGLLTASSSSEAPMGDRLVLHAGRDLMESVKIPKVGKPLALGAVLVRLLCIYSKNNDIQLAYHPSVCLFTDTTPCPASLNYGAHAPHTLLPTS